MCSSSFHCIGLITPSNVTRDHIMGRLIDNIEHYEVSTQAATCKVELPGSRLSSHHSLISTGSSCPLPVTIVPSFGLPTIEPLPEITKVLPHDAAIDSPTPVGRHFRRVLLAAVVVFVFGIWFIYQDSATCGAGSGLIPVMESRGLDSSH
jgi:hypothetical protein